MDLIEVINEVLELHVEQSIVASVIGPKNVGLFLRFTYVLPERMVVRVPPAPVLHCLPRVPQLHHPRVLVVAVCKLGGANLHGE